jgi:hypothetical protein
MDACRRCQAPLAIALFEGATTSRGAADVTVPVLGWTGFAADFLTTVT